MNTQSHNSSNKCVPSRAGVWALAPDLAKATDPRRKMNQTDTLLRCKKVSKISSFNVRTLRSVKQASELTASASQFGIDVICIQEHRILHSDTRLLSSNLGNGWTLLHASATKNSTNGTIGGVGMLLSLRAQNALISVEVISSRTITATFSGNPRTTVISCYSPTNVSDEQEVIHFYDDLSSLIRAIPKHNLLILGGDFNAQLGVDEYHKYAFHTATNRNGEHLRHFLIENDLICLNTRFQKKKGKL